VLFGSIDSLGTVNSISVIQLFKTVHREVPKLIATDYLSTLSSSAFSFVQSAP